MHLKSRLNSTKTLLCNLFYFKPKLIDSDSPAIDYAVGELPFVLYNPTKGSGKSVEVSCLQIAKSNTASPIFYFLTIILAIPSSQPPSSWFAPFCWARLIFNLIIIIFCFLLKEFNLKKKKKNYMIWRMEQILLPCVVMLAKSFRTA